MPSQKAPYVRIDYLSDLSETATGIQNYTPVRSATGTYWPEIISTTDSTQSQAVLEIPIESKTYGSGKPRRIVIRGKIARDKD
jgi:hypothetical protein